MNGDVIGRQNAGYEGMLEGMCPASSLSRCKVRYNDKHNSRPHFQRHSRQCRLPGYINRGNLYAAFP